MLFQAFILIPLFSVIILNLPFRRIMKKTAVGFALTLFISQTCAGILPVLGSSGQKIGTFGSIFKFELMVDSLTRVMLLCIGIVSFISLLAGRYLIEDEEERFNFVNLLLLASCGMNGVVMATDIFSLFVFIEITTTASLILVAFKTESAGFEAAFKYLVLSATATILMFSSIALLLLISGSTGFSALRAALETSPHNYLIMCAVGLFLCGLFLKGGLAPFHAWLADAHSAAPTAVSVFLSGVQIKVVGAYALLRVVTSVFGYTKSVSAVVMAVAAISIVFGAVAALGQNDFKRMLAYSSISNMGYILLGFGSGAGLAIAGAALHLFNHAIFKSLLFVNSAAVEQAVGTRDMEKMGGLAARMPLTAVTSVLASLSAAGLPPLAGFWSKLIIVLGLWMSGYRAYALLAALASVITLAYLISMQRKIFFGDNKQELEDVEEVGLGLAFPELLLAAITVGVGLFFPFIWNNFFLPIRSLFGG